MGGDGITHKGTGERDASLLVKRHLTQEASYAIIEFHKVFQEVANRRSGGDDVRAAVSGLAAKEQSVRSAVEVS